MRAGLLKEILVFEEPVEVQTSTGFPRQTWNPVLTCKAYKKKHTATPGDEMNALEEFVENTVVFQTYRYPVIKETQRIIWNGNIYRITLLDPQAFDNSYLITCKKDNK